VNEQSGQTRLTQRKKEREHISIQKTVNVLEEDLAAIRAHRPRGTLGEKANPSDKH